jgi:diguanylate cyclase (GGDEF)-like protein
MTGNHVLPFCIVIGDVNNLKITNDQLGHQVGDQLLIKVAQIMQNQISSTNTICRIGGDEFVILMPGAEAFEAESLIRRIRTTASSEQKEPVPISISFGLCCISDYNTDIMEAFRHAENLMYDNKSFEKTKFNRNLSSNRTVERQESVEEHPFKEGN